MALAGDYMRRHLQSPKAVGHIGVDDLHRLEWICEQLLVLIALWGIATIDVISVFVLLGLATVCFATVLWPGLPGKIPHFIWRLMTPLVVAFIIVDFILNRQEVLEVLVRMVLILMIYRALQYRNRREDLQLMLLCLFSLVLEGVLTLSIAFAFQIIIFTPLAMSILFMVNLLERSYGRRLTAKDWVSFSWPRLMRMMVRTIDLRLLGGSVLLFVALVGISSLLFVAMPRFRMDQALPFLQIKGKGLMGFSDQIRFGDVNELLDDGQVALRVSVPRRELVPQQPYWRMVVLDQYYDGVFRVSSSLRRSSLHMRTANLFFYDYGGRDIAEIEANEWVFYLEGDTSRYLPLLGPFEQVRFPKQVKFLPYRVTNVFALEQVPAKVFGYSVLDMQMVDSIAALPSEVEQLAHLRGPIRVENPKGVLGKIPYPVTTLLIPSSELDVRFLLDQVAEIRNGEELDVHTFAQRAVDWLAKNYKYDTEFKGDWDDVGDPLTQWMRLGERGWCEHFTGAFVLLCRAAGYPARSVAGFVGAEWNDYEDYMVVRNRNAHAWAEVYDGEGRWFRVDPTPAVGSTFSGRVRTRGQGIVAFSGWQAWMDSIRMLWYRRIVNFDEADQLQFVSSVQGDLKDIWFSIKASIKEFAGSLVRWLKAGWDLDKLLQFVVILFCAVVIGFVVYFVYQGIVLCYWRLRSHQDMRAVRLGLVRRQAGELLVRFIGKHGSLQPENLDEEIGVVSRQLLAIRYGPPRDIHQPKSVFRRARRLLR